MAVEITVADLASAIRVGTTSAETAQVTRVRAYAIEAISHHLGDAYADAPVVVVNEAAVRLGAYLYDAPTISGRDGFAFAMRSSGAGRMLLPYVVHTLGSTGDAAVTAAQAATGTVGNPVFGVTVNGAELVVTFADGTTEMHDLPAGMGGMFNGTDQTARDAAAAAQATADTALEAAPAPTELGTASLSIETAATFHPLGLTLPAGKTWAYISMGTHTEQVLPAGVPATYAPGPWQRFLIADLLGLPDVTASTTPDSVNAVHTEVELQNFRELDIGTSASGEMFASIPHKNASTTITGPLRVQVE